jgi:phage tail tape-measure protein
MAAGYGVGASLASFGQGQKQEAVQLLGRAADEEAARNARNKQLEAEEEAGKKQLGASLGGLAGGAIAGATWGSAAGPWGTLIGGVIGAIAGGLF